MLVAFGLSSPAHSCACGCGIFDIGTSSMFPHSQGGMFSLEYDYMDQNRNWSGTSRASSNNNDDKEIRTHFVTAGVQYMFNRQWGVSGELPVWDRYFKTTGDSGDIESFSHAALGDIRLKAIYTGLSPDMSTGLTFGVKLPTGDSSYANFDSDTEIGSGSTDVLLGAYQLGTIGDSAYWRWFANGQVDLPVVHPDAYRPGSEFDGSLGAYYHSWVVGKYMVSPLVQLVGSYRLRDGGVDADPQDSGYERALITPGIEVHSGRYKIYADVGLPVYQNVNGNQLTAAELIKVNVSEMF